ncbi:hypothetical protein CRYUN_Cryun33cG0059500 [Craigia yunnanensis]
MEDDFEQPGLWNGVPMFIACILQPIGDCNFVIIQGKKEKRNKGVEANYKLLFPWEIFYQFWDTPFNDVLSAIPIFRTAFLGISLVFMLLYVWSREFPNAQINIYGLVTLKAFYLPCAMLALDVIFGSPLFPDLLCIIAGHLYYFLTVLHPLATGKVILKTPLWVHKLVARWRIGAPAQPSSRAAAQPDRSTGVAFRGRSYRLNG